jgi:O-succinylbenzoic acid--CoA ligase
VAEIKCPIWEAAQISPEENFIASPEGNLKFSEAEQLVTATADRLSGIGWNEGDRIAICMPNDWRIVIVLFAMLRKGIVACPLDPRIPPDAAEDLINRIEATAVISADEDAADQTAARQTVVSITSVIGLFSSQPAAAGPATIDLNQPATIVFTSGSSGEPKAVLHSVANHYYSALGSNRNLPLRSKDSWLLSLPLHHVSGLSIAFRCCVAGATLVLPDSADSLVDALYLHDPTHLSMVATQLCRFLDEREGWREDRKLRVVLVGGGPVPSSMLETAREAGVPVFMTYGLTEMASQVTTVGFDTPRQQRGTSGQTLKYGELRMAEDGEIMVRGRTRFLGYVEGGDLVRPFDEDGWYASGDLGELDADGFLTVLGRKDNMFVSGGENIYPEEIESALCNLPGVEAAVVVPVNHPEFGKRPVAFVKGNGADFDPDRTGAELAETLPKFKIPDAWYPWPEHAPQNGLKISREMFCELAESD